MIVRSLCCLQQAGTPAYPGNLTALLFTAPTGRGAPGHIYWLFFGIEVQSQDADGAGGAVVEGGVVADVACGEEAALLHHSA